MAFLDRLKDATKPTNTIEAVQEQGQATPPDLHRASPTQPQAAPPAEARTAGKDAKAPAYSTEPEAISKAYYVEDRGAERRYFDDYKKTNLAIRSDDTTINSKREDLNTIRAMLTMAESRGWQEVKVNGSAEFKREAWIEAETRGIKAQGYKATDVDRQEADRRRTERGPDTPKVTPTEGNEVQRVIPPTQTVAPANQPEARQAPISREAVAPVPAEPRQAPVGREAVAPVPAEYDRSDPRVVLRQTQAALSESGKLMLDELSKNIDQKMPGIGEDQRLGRKVILASDLLMRQDADASQQIAKLTKEQVQTVAKDQTRVPTNQEIALATAEPKQTVNRAPTQQEVEPTRNDHRKSLREATAELSPDGRLMLAAVSEKIDREMNKMNNDGKAELKAYFATELVKKEKVEGPVVLSPELKRAATAPEPTTQQKAPEPERQPERRMEPEEPRRTRSR